MGRSKTRIAQAGRAVTIRRELPPLEDDLDVTPPREIATRSPKVTMRGAWDGAILGNPPGPKDGVDSGEMSGRSPRVCDVPRRDGDTKMF